MRNNVKFVCRKIGAIKAFPMSDAFAQCIVENYIWRWWYRATYAVLWPMKSHVSPCDFRFLPSSIPPLVHCASSVMSFSRLAIQQRIPYSKASYISPPNHNAYTSQKVRLSAIFKCLYCYPYCCCNVRLMPFTKLSPCPHKWAKGEVIGESLW